MAQCTAKATYTITSGQGAVLAMENDTITTIDPPGRLCRFLDSLELQGCLVVSEVHRCSSYARYLSFTANRAVSIGIGARDAITSMASADASVTWRCTTKVGNFKSNAGKQGRRDFYPLFRLVSSKDTEVSIGLGGDDTINFKSRTSE